MTNSFLIAPNWLLILIPILIDTLVTFLIKYSVYITKMPNSFLIAPNWLLISPN